jgi:hypothetical protein
VKLTGCEPLWPSAVCWSSIDTDGDDSAARVHWPPAVMSSPAVELAPAPLPEHEPALVVHAAPALPLSPTCDVEPPPPLAEQLPDSVLQEPLPAAATVFGAEVPSAAVAQLPCGVVHEVLPPVPASVDCPVPAQEPPGEVEPLPVKVLVFGSKDALPLPPTDS